MLSVKVRARGFLHRVLVDLNPINACAEAKVQVQILCLLGQSSVVKNVYLAAVMGHRLHLDAGNRLGKFKRFDHDKSTPNFVFHILCRVRGKYVDRTLEWGLISLPFTTCCAIIYPFHPALYIVAGPLVRGEEVNCLRKYEIIFILRPDLDEEKNQATIDKFKGIIENNGGEVAKLDKWGKRRLAYEINDLREGFYVVSQVKATPDIIAELDRIFKITDEVMRHMIVKEEE